MKYKFLSHTADIKFQAFGNSLEESFENSAYALVNIICKDRVKSKIKKILKVRGKNRERLLYEFLEEILYKVDAEDFVLGEVVKIEIESRIKSRKPLRYELELKAEILGDDLKNYETETSVKAVTYNEMYIKQDNNKFIVQVVVDV